MSDPGFLQKVDRWVEDSFGIDLSAYLGLKPPPPGHPASPQPPVAKPAPAATAAPEQKKKDETADLGGLSEKYEAGKRGSSAVGNDNTGGWSYGKYQIATKTGTMKKFLAYVKENDPDLSKTLEDAGGGKGAADHTDTFAKAWADAAAGGKLEALEHGFISATHYKPLADAMAGDGLDLSKRSKALRDVAWSISVQHGPGSKVIETALNKLLAGEQAKDKKAGATRTKQEIIDAIADKDLINAVYDERESTKEVDGKKVLKYFGGSTQDVQDSVAKRFKDERKAAQKELTDESAAAAKKPQ